MPKKENKKIRLYRNILTGVLGFSFQDAKTKFGLSSCLKRMSLYSVLKFHRKTILRKLNVWGSEREGGEGGALYRDRTIILLSRNTKLSKLDRMSHQFSLLESKEPDDSLSLSPPCPPFCISSLPPIAFAIKLNARLLLDECTSTKWHSSRKWATEFFPLDYQSLVWKEVMARVYKTLFFFFREMENWRIKTFLESRIF